MSVLETNYTLMKWTESDEGNMGITNTILDIIYHPVFYLKLNAIGLSVSHRKHITSPLRAQHVNAICRFVTMVY
jgi:hypothetical protein